MERGIFGVGVFEYACVLFQRYSESIISTGKPLTNNNIPRKSKPHFFSLFLVFLKQNTDVSEDSDIEIFLFVLKFGQGVDVRQIPVLLPILVRFVVFFVLQILLTVLPIKYVYIYLITWNAETWIMKFYDDNSNDSIYVGKFFLPFFFLQCLCFEDMLSV